MKPIFYLHFFSFYRKIHVAEAGWMTLLFLLCAFASQGQILPKVEPIVLPGTAGGIEHESGAPREATAWTWNISSKGSDYYMYFTFNDFPHWCDCANEWVVKLKYGGSTKTFTFTSRSHSGNSYLVAVGPGRTLNYSWTGEMSGTNNAVFNCWVGCSGSGNSTSTLSRTSSSIKAPTNVVATDREALHTVKVSWGKGTDIPNENHGYQIYRDDLNSPPVATVNGFTRSWTDTKVNPNETHTYYVRTYTNSWGGYSSSFRSDQGSTQPATITATDGEFSNRTKITWTNLSSFADKIEVWRNDEQLEADLGGGTTQYDDRDGIPGFNYTYKVIPVRDDNLNDYRPLEDVGYRTPNGTFTGEVKAPFGGPVSGVRVCAELLDSIPPGADGKSIYCDTTDGSGFFEIKDIYYYDRAKFAITPYLENHGFNPASLERTLDLQNPSFNSLNFIDTTSFTVNGRVTQVLDGDTCGLANVRILVEDLFQGTLTDSDGNYSLTVQETGTYAIAPEFEGHSFEPAEQEFFIDEDLTGVDFENTQMDTLKGFVLAGCNIFIGTAEVTVTALNGPSGCFQKTVTTADPSGFYEVVLPSRAYRVEVTRFVPENPAESDAEEIVNFFEPDTLDLTNGAVEKDFIFRKPPEIKVLGMPDPICDLPVAHQTSTYPLEIQVFESFGNESCLTSSGHVIILDDTGDRFKRDTILLEGGIAYYDLLPGEPNIIAPHTKQIEILADVDGQTDTYSQPLIVTGNRPREKTFSTVSPEVPFMILRDPPGDASYSYLEEETSTRFALGFSARASTSVKAWGEVKVGAKFEAGIGISTETEIWGKIKQSLEVGASVGSQTELAMEIINAQRYATSGNPDITGKEGDVYIGSALNMIYALTDVIEYDENQCKVNKSVDLIVGNDGFATTFMYTEGHIRNTLIPQLQTLQGIYEAQGSDSAQVYRDQVEVWQQTLTLNEKLKEKATFIENRSFSAGVPFNSSSEVNKSSSGSLEFNLYIESSVAAEAGLEVGGIGASGGVETRFRMDFGSSVSASQSYSRTTGYFFDDDDVGDFFSVDILADEVYGTPVFALASGTSSCPWEPGTQPREGVQLVSNTRLRTGIDPEEEAVFQIQLGNTSQSDEDQAYDLIFLQESNPDGAQVKLGGSEVQGGVPTPFSIPAGKSVNATVTVERGPVAFDYDDLQFVLMSSCGDRSISDTLSLSVRFTSPCSDIVLHRPESGWLIKQGDEDRLDVNFRGYDPDALNEVKLQYAPTGTNVWSTLEVFDKGQLNNSAGGTNAVLSALDIPDGEYDLRMVLGCDEGIKYTEKARGKIDRKGPSLFGVPEPSDGRYEGGDVISVTFDEPLDCSGLENNMITVIGQPSGKPYPVQVNCSDNQLFIEPGQVGDQVLEIQVSDLKDPYGNVMANPVRWSFDSDLVTRLQVVAGASMDLELFPNPASAQATLVFSLERPEWVVVQLYDLSGKLVGRTYQANLPSGKQRVQLDLGGLANGMYFVRLASGRTVATQKLRIQQ